MTDDALFRQWLEVNSHVRHWERLLSERMTTTMWVLTACIGATVMLVAIQGLEFAANRRLAAVSMAFAAVPATVGYFLVVGARRQLQHHRQVRYDLETRATFGWTHLAPDCLHQVTALAAIVLSVWALVAGACWLLYLPQSYFEREGGVQRTRMTIDGLPALVESADRLAQSFALLSGASGLVVVKGLDELTQSVNRLSEVQGREPSAPSSVSVEGLAALTDAIGRLVDRPASIRQPLQLSDPGSDSVKPEKFAFEAVAENATSTTDRVVAGGAVFVAMVGMIGAMFMRAPAGIKAIVATTSLALGITGTLPLTFKGEINLKGELSCGSGGCIRVERGGSILRELAPTPSFGIGASESTSQIGACVDDDKNAEAWANWREKIVKEWNERTDPKPTDIVLLRGSADPRPLTGPLRQRYETNGGLALARAEHVAGLLEKYTAKEVRAEHRLDRTRVLALAAGPAGTGAPSEAASGLQGCADLTRQDQRRVRVWILEAAR